MRRPAGRYRVVRPAGLYHPTNHPDGREIAVAEAMTDFVFALVDGVSSWPDGAVVTTARGQVWDANDQFVKARPDLFSQSPPLVHNTTGGRVVEVRSLADEGSKGRPKRAAR